MDGDRGPPRNVRGMVCYVWNVHVDGSGHVPGGPLVVVAGVEHGHHLAAEDPGRQVFDVGGLEGRQRAASGLPGIQATIERTSETIESDAMQLALRLNVIRRASADQDDRSVARHQPANPRAERAALESHAVAARDVPAVVVDS